MNPTSLIIPISKATAREIRSAMSALPPHEAFNRGFTLNIPSPTNRLGNYPPDDASLFRGTVDMDHEDSDERLNVREMPYLVRLAAESAYLLAKRGDLSDSERRHLEELRASLKRARI